MLDPRTSTRPGTRPVRCACVQHDLVELSEHVWSRTAARLEWLEDDEYLWEPAPVCWSIRPDEDGVWRMDEGPVAGDAPFTTIA